MQCELKYLKCKFVDFPIKAFWQNQNENSFESPSLWFMNFWINNDKDAFLPLPKWNFFRWKYFYLKHFMLFEFLITNKIWLWENWQKRACFFESFQREIIETFYFPLNYSLKSIINTKYDSFWNCYLIVALMNKALDNRHFFRHQFFPFSR